MASRGPRAEAARSAFRGLAAAPGHAVENARRAAAVLEHAFASGDLVRTPDLDLMLRDLAATLARDEDQRLGGKSAEAARLILKAIGRAIEQA